MTEDQRRTVIYQWNMVRNVFEEYSEKLSPEQREMMSRFFLQPLTDRKKLARYKAITTYRREQQERV